MRKSLEILVVLATVSCGAADERQSSVVREPVVAPRSAGFSLAPVPVERAAKVEPKVITMVPGMCTFDRVSKVLVDLGSSCRTYDLREHTGEEPIEQVEPSVVTYYEIDCKIFFGESFTGTWVADEGGRCPAGQILAGGRDCSSLVQNKLQFTLGGVGACPADIKRACTSDVTSVKELPVTEPYEQGCVDAPLPSGNID